MPRERIPEDELFRQQSKLQQSAPDNRRRGLGKSTRAFLKFACAMPCDAGKNFIRLNPVIFLFAEQDSLRGHGDAAEVTATVSKRFANYCESRGFKSFAEVSA